jgi:hypothetical protein
VPGADDVRRVAVVGEDLFAGLDRPERDDAGDHAKAGMVDRTVDGVWLKRVVNLFENMHRSNGELFIF